MSSLTTRCLQTPAMWNAVRLPQTRGPLSAPQPGFVLDVYQDEDMSPPPATRPAASHAPLRKLEAEVRVPVLQLDEKRSHASDSSSQQGSNLLTHPVLNHVSAERAAAVAELQNPMQAHEMKRYGVRLCLLCRQTCSHSYALRSISEALQAAQSNGEVSFEEARALRWLNDPKNAAPVAPVPPAAPVAPTLPPVAEVVAAEQPASPLAAVPQPPEPFVVAAPEPVAPEAVAVPLQAAASEVPQVAPARALHLASATHVDPFKAQAEHVPVQASVNVGAEKPRFPRALRTFVACPGFASLTPSAFRQVPVADDTNMTINMRDAYADIMTMFSDALPGQTSRKRACNASSSGRAGAGVAMAEPLFEVYEGEASPADSPSAFDNQGVAAADADVLAVFEDEPADDGDCGEYASDAENEDPLQLHHPVQQATAVPEDALVFQPWSSEQLRAAGGEDAELDAEMHAAAEAALRAAAGPAELLAQDSFEVYEDTAALPEDVSQALGGDTACKIPQLQFGAPPPNAFDTFEVYEDTTAIPPVALAEQATSFINPFSAAVMAQMLSSMDEPVCVMPGVTDEDESAAAKLESSLSAARRHPHSGVVLQLGGFKYVLGRLCGRGAYADIYEAVDEDDLGDSSSAPVMALKVVRPPDSAAASWEFVVLRRVAERVPASKRQLFLQARRLHMAGPLAVLVTAFGPHGTLQDAVNALLGSNQGCMHESLAMYLTVELLRALEVLHAASFIHGDVKPDNVLLRLGGSQWEEWTPSRPGTWRERGIALIDFGRSIDLTAHAPGAAFMGDSGTENFRCVEMLSDKPWTFQADTFGVLGCVHVMLFGAYMEVDFDKGASRWRRREPLKRYMRTKLWEPLFDALLNVPSCQQQPELRRFRAAFEEHLAAPARAAEVRSEFMKLTITMADAAKAAR